MYVVESCHESPVMQAVRKKQLEAEKKLGKYGRIIDTTPASVREEFADYASPTTKDAAKSAAAGAVKKAGVETEVKQEPGVETLSAVTTATPTAVALSSAKRKVWPLEVVVPYTYRFHRPPL